LSFGDKNLESSSPIAMLHIHSSNRVETLAERLGALMKEPLSDPLQADHIIVHSHGLERWLSLQLASSLGVCANIEFPFPVPFLTDVMVQNTPGWDERRASLLDPETLIWALMDVLPEVSRQPGAEALDNFLGKEASSPDVRLYQLSQYLGRLFDRYQIYRPQILQRWLSGRLLEEETWQALVWQALIQRTGPYHRFALKNSFQRHLKNTQPAELKGLPPRVMVFGVSTLAPFFVDILAAIAPYTDLHLFFLNPCQEYWGDILSRKQRMRRKRSGNSGDPRDQLELGLSAEPDFENELLAYFGKMGRDFFDLLVDLETANHEESYTPPEKQTALAALQTDILQLQEGQGTILSEAEEAVPSLQIHSCHSRMREIEVLNDALLNLFEKRPDLTARDVIVMAPNMEDYSSKIHAVFGRPCQDERFIPYDIADRTPRLSHTLGSALLRLISLAESRWEASEVLSVLESSPIMRRFGITDTGLDTLRHWVAESGIRWARDAPSKAALDLPEIHENTWQFGLDRLLLGYAMPENNRGVFAGVLPYDHVEGSDLEVLGQFLTLWDQLNALSRQLEGPHSAARWAQIGRQIVGQFFIDDPIYERELTYLYQVFEELEETTTKASFSGEISLSVVQAYLESRLDESRTSGGFFTGGVTFCNLLPMRSIPFRVVVLLGMSAQAFPRQDREFAFDLTRDQPMRGDRSRKQEDRYMFLEAMLAARDHFIVLYTGQSLKDNSEISPSVFVTQVHDYLERVYHMPKGAFATVHRLQPFSAVYFDPESQFRTFAREYLETTNPSLHEPLIIIDDETEHPSTQEKIVEVEDLIRFLQHPVAAFYQNKFSLYKPSDALETADVEPVMLNALDAWQLDQWILELVEADLPIQEIGALIKSSGHLPHGAHGKSELQHLLAGVMTFQEQMHKFLGGPALEPVPVDLQVGDWRLLGQLRGLREQGLRRVCFGRLRPQEQYQLWVEHLIIQSLPDRPNQSSAILGRGTKIFALQAFNTPHAAMHELKALLAIREKGLQRPLPIFPRTSMTFAKQRKNRKGFGECKSKAYEEWRGRNIKIAEEQDYYHHLAFGQVEDPLDNEFSDLCEKAIRPLLENEARNAGL
jgi:exodeoxyribonuclease V gamma subunit